MLTIPSSVWAAGCLTFFCVACATAPRIPETAEDLPWANAARNLSANLPTGKTSLKAEVPSLAAQIGKDRKNKTLLSLWGRSVNFDENAKAIIVDPKTLIALHQAAGVRSPALPDARIAHAGVEHTYGYLLSNLPTPYGFKRARWIQPTLDRGLGMSEPTLTAEPRHGTLLQNVTVFAGRIAFWNDRTELGRIAKRWKTYPKSLKQYPFDSLQVSRLEETIHDGKRTVVLRTDLVKFPNPTGDANTHLLVYSVRDSDVGGARLITAFPVMSDFAKSLFDEKNLGDDKPISVRYNAYVPKLSGQTWRGKRQKL